MKTITTLSAVGLVAISIFISGCAQPTATAPEFDTSPYLLTAEPEAAHEVISAREKSADGDSIAVVGRIGGSAEPWVKDRAAFWLVDNSLLACSDEKADGETCSCKTPWDYCCETDKLPGAMILVKFVDGDGNVVKHGAKAAFGLKELQTIVVQGTAQRDDAGNLTVLASGMFARK